MTVAKVALRPQALGQRSLLRPDLNGGNGSEGDIRDNGFYVKCTAEIAFDASDKCVKMPRV